MKKGFVHFYSLSAGAIASDQTPRDEVRITLLSAQNGRLYWRESSGKVSGEKKQGMNDKKGGFFF
ncbi:MAG: hypothetical protein CVU51_15550 [Deltaproteobacteria bacterium HGW-Deltaproteobacteria-1]|jgi:hypothetical protein|nr:MAG: hypothetical protein CVU51_15550 [Deltaproteobacteria bacterium HGW-Deltaproteobacteria-1]